MKQETKTLEVKSLSTRILSFISLGWLFGRWKRSARPPNPMPHLSAHIRRDLGLPELQNRANWRKFF